MSAVNASGSVDAVEPLDPLEAYEAGLTAGRWQEDAAQRRVVTELARIQVGLMAATPDSLFERLLRRFARPRTVRGLYVWGGVGRGKTFLMDLFHASLPFPQKLRLHFHAFMQKVHVGLASLKNVEDPLEVVAERLAAETRVICFDEFVVIDIGDAMILGRLLKHLFERGVTLVATSNCAPEQLYKDGLQRASFLPAIALLQQHCQVLHLDSPHDYRLRTLTQARIYLHPHDAGVQAELADLFVRVAPGEVDTEVDLDINERAIRALQVADGVAWFHFDALCRGPRSAVDYIEIARSYNTVLLSAVPQLGVADENEARRFIHLVDALYDHRVNLILSADVPLESLYAGERVAFEFRRTVSRLTEMQSQEYLAAAHAA